MSASQTSTDTDSKAKSVPHPSGLTRKERKALRNKQNRENKRKYRHLKQKGRGAADRSVAVNAVAKVDSANIADWKDFGLHPEVFGAVTQQLGYKTPSEVQKQVIPHAMVGKDVMACAMTGTGKTAAFVLPMLHRLLNSTRRSSATVRLTFGLVLTPTRELAIQIHKFIVQAGHEVMPRITCGVVYGRMSEKEVLKYFKKKVDFIVACPGRMQDIMRKHYSRCRMRHISVLVLDEADKMLEMGFLEEVRSILAMVTGEESPTEAKIRKRHPQMMLFSATFPDAVNALASNILNSPAELHVKSTVPSGVTQCIYLSPDRWNCKQFMFLELFKPIILDASRGTLQVLDGRESSSSSSSSSSGGSSMPLVANKGVTVLTFVSQRGYAESLAHFLEANGVAALVLHGELSMQKRIDALEAFKSGSCSVLVTTNVLSRGVDIPGLSHVVNFEVPKTVFDYIHRVGRTARAERRGEALMFVGPNELDALAEIEEYLGYGVVRKVLPDFDYGRFMKPGLPKPAPKQVQTPDEKSLQIDEIEDMLSGEDNDVMVFDDEGQSVAYEPAAKKRKLQDNVSASIRNNMSKK